MVAPLAFVVDIHALFALAGGLGHRAVGVEDGFREECFGLLPPDLQPRSVEDRLQAEDGCRVEAAAEVARRGRIGNAAGAQGVEVGLVVPQQFQVFQTGSAGQQVVGDREHVVGIVVGQMNLQQAEVAIDGLVQPEPLAQQMDGPDAAIGGCPHALSEFVVDVRGGHDRPVASSVVIFVQPPRDPPLASFDPFSYLGTHSKTSLLRNWGRCSHPQYVGKHRRFSSFFIQRPKRTHRGSLG